MNSRLALFNPDHDLALANNDAHFNAPLSAKRFGHDLHLLPIWWDEEKVSIRGTESDRCWLEMMQAIFPALLVAEIVDGRALSWVNSATPWGWNRSLVNELLESGMAIDRLPSDEQLHKIRELSHRETAIRAHRYLMEMESLRAVLPPEAQLLKLRDVVAFVEKEGDVVYKAPWSGSGKGLCWAKGGVSDSIYGWCKNVIAKQGAVVGERVYDRIQDFAMLFECGDRSVSFAGYSLFATERGTYRCNELMSNPRIEAALIDKGADAGLLSMIRERLILFLEKEIAPHYSGPLGVDMFLYREGDVVKIHPCVEINLRRTMGFVARHFFDRFVDKNAHGRFYIDHFPTSEQLMVDHLESEKTSPLVVKSGRILDGYMALHPIAPTTIYRARVLLYGGAND